MFAAYFVIFLLQAQLKMFPEIYGTFAQSFGSLLVWMSFAAVITTSCIPELAVKYYYQYIIAEDPEMDEDGSIVTAESSISNRDKMSINMEGGSREYPFISRGNKNSFKRYTPPNNAG